MREVDEAGEGPAQSKTSFDVTLAEGTEPFRAACRSDHADPAADLVKAPLQY